jgi:hypothetical protein
MRISFAIALLAASVVMPASAEPQAVEIKGTRNPELKTYRVMAAGLDAFDEHHALAPNATELRFRLRGREGSNADLNALSLRVSGEHISIDVPIAADLTFALPRSEAAADENADLVLNKPKGRYRWQPEIRSAGVPDHMRRLGDLRLECEVLMAVGKAEMSFMMKAMVNSLLLTTRWCTNEHMRIPTISPRKLASATLLHGGQRIPLKLISEDTRFEPPLPDKTYPDDTLIELEFAEAPVP